MWLSVDAMAEKSPNAGPYNYCLGNPVNMVDPDGNESTSPIYGRNGQFLGTDDNGLKGKAIIMKKDDFKQGMSHEEALSKSIGFEGLKGGNATSKF